MWRSRQSCGIAAKSCREATYYIMDVNKTILQGSDIFTINQTWDAAEAAKLPARTLAYIGDAVYELALRLNHVA